MDFSFFGRGWGVRLLRSKGLVMKLQNEHLLILRLCTYLDWLAAGVVDGDLREVHLPTSHSTAAFFPRGLVSG